MCKNIARLGRCALVQRYDGVGPPSLLLRPYLGETKQNYITNILTTSPLCTPIMNPSVTPHVIFIAVENRHSLFNVKAQD